MSDLKQLPAFDTEAERAHFAKTADLAQYNMNSEVGRAVMRDWLESTKGREPLPVFKTDEDAERFVDKADLSEYDLSGGRPMSEVLPRTMKRGRPKSANPKKLLTIRLDADLIERLKADGDGWQTRINDTLRKAVGM
jgi:uncharacterized protein (DUF4415 family)